jgi:hypothetical protein
MPVHLSEPFSGDPQWEEMAEHANQLLGEFGYYNYEIMIRLASKDEMQEPEPEDRFDCQVTPYFDSSKCSLELVHMGELSVNFPSYTTPKEYANINVVGILCEFLEGNDAFDPDDSGSGRSFRVIEGGKR